MVACVALCVNAACAPNRPGGAMPTATAPGRGRLPPGVIQQEVRRHYRGFRACYLAGVARERTLEGRVVVRFAIERDGTVGWAKVNPATTMPDRSVVDCVVKEYEKIVFPSPEGGIVTVVYPIRFAPGPGPRQ
jgi:TonB family protein